MLNIPNVTFNHYEWKLLFFFGKKGLLLIFLYFTCE